MVSETKQHWFYFYIYVFFKEIIVSIFQIVNTQGKLNMGHKRERKTGSDERVFVQRGVELKILIENGVFYQYIETLPFLLASTMSEIWMLPNFGWFIIYIICMHLLSVSCSQILGQDFGGCWGGSLFNFNT